MSDQRFYDIVAVELQRRSLRPGLWTRAVAETGGEGEAARALYIRLRVAELEQIEHAESARAEAKRRATEDARRQKERRAEEQRRKTGLRPRADASRLPVLTSDGLLSPSSSF
jgi:hypothetical protein